MRRELVDERHREVDRHGDQRSVNVLAECIHPRPVLAVQLAYLIAGCGKPLGEIAPHLSAGADNEHATARPHRHPADLDRLTHPGVPNDRPIEFFDVVRVQVGADRLIAAL